MTAFTFRERRQEMMKWGAVAMTLLVALVVSTRDAAALDVQQILISQGTDRTNGTADGYYFETEILGTGINDGVFVCINTGAWYALTVSGGGTEADYEDMSASMAALLATHPNPAQYQFYFNQTKPNPTPADFQDTVLLGYGVAPPTGFAAISNPTQDETGVVLDPNYTWSDVVGMGGYLGSWVCEESAPDVDVYAQLDGNMARTTWQPGAIDPWTDYEIEVSVMNVAGANLQTANADTFVYYGVFDDNNCVDFETIPEPMTMTLVGTTVLVLYGRRRRRRMG